MSDFPFPDIQEAYNQENLEKQCIFRIIALKENGWSLQEIKNMPLSMFFKIGSYYKDLSEERQKANKNG